METSTVISIAALIISMLALRQSYLSHKATIISEIKKEMADRASDCNKYIVPGTLQPPNVNQDVSAVVTAIIYAKKQLKVQYDDHTIMLAFYKQRNFLRYFYCQLHSSIIELIKHPLVFSNYDPSTSPEIEKQQLECRQFLQSVIDENLSR
jgi:hypothetical protein